MKVQRGVGKKSSGRYQMQYEEEYFYEEEAEGEDESDVRQRWPARSADGKFRVSAAITSTHFRHVYTVNVVVAFLQQTGTHVIAC